jgi:oligopeptide/dipeptide ABC transporter ATP-binding protein
VTLLSLLGLIPSPPAEIRANRILFQNSDLNTMDPEALRRIRGRDLAMIFQEPMTSLNPVLTIGRQVAEPLMVHYKLSKKKALEEALVWLEHVRMPAAKSRLNDYPHQLSGGMRQRVMIAMAMVCRPKLLVADEPTTALDVTIQAQILALMMGLKNELNMSVLLITHDLGVVAQTASRVVVMYAGQVVEESPVRDLFETPLHPYTQGLLKSVPRLGRRSDRLSEIKGTVPPLTGIIAGCKFADRCPRVLDRCREKQPGLFRVGPGRTARCWLVEDAREAGDF